MNRNSDSHFSTNPTNIDIQRSKFKRESSHKLTMNAGQCIPMFWDEVLPGDSFNLTTASAIRMSTPIYPVMDNCSVDTYYFFVPMRLVWQHAKNFFGENTESKWAPEIEYTIPQITAPSGGWECGTIADFMGVPTHVENLSISALPFRAYALCMNEWFRDQNLKDPCYINTDDATQNGSNGSTYQTDVQLGGMPFRAAKFHDYFTSALNSPQKGPSILMPLGKDAPIIGADGWPGTPTEKGLVGKPLAFYRQNPFVSSTSYIFTEDGNATQFDKTINMVADLSQATAATINELRTSFQIQRYYEALARGGSRYRETIRSLFGVVSPDARMQIPEYLGGARWNINIDQVIKTSSTDEMSPQGNAAAFSLTNNINHDFVKSFTEHGFIIGIAVIRNQSTYQQGLERAWSRKTVWDFYNPKLANISEQAILRKEIYATGTDDDELAFGYQEAWADYRYKNNRVSGKFRSVEPDSLDSWHYADYYESAPILGETWIDAPQENIDRTLATQSSLEPQFIADFYFDLECTRPMPLYSIPGLIDHH